MMITSQATFDRINYNLLMKRYEELLRLTKEAPYKADASRLQAEASALHGLLESYCV